MQAGLEELLDPFCTALVDSLRPLYLKTIEVAPAPYTIHPKLEIQNPKP
jgi:hypothetical protein